jgi:hypothetical protein
MSRAEYKNLRKAVRLHNLLDEHAESVRGDLDDAGYRPPASAEPARFPALRMPTGLGAASGQGSVPVRR